LRSIIPSFFKGVKVNKFQGIKGIVDFCLSTYSQDCGEHVDKLLFKE